MTRVMPVSNSSQLGPQFCSRILCIDKCFSFTSQQQFSVNYKYSLCDKITRECPHHGYLESFIPYHLALLD